MGQTTTASGVETERAQFSSDGFTIKAFLAKPLKTGWGLPAILILHEWWGLNEHITDIAQRLAREDYVAFAPDLYSRLGSQVACEPAEAAKLMNALSSQAVLRDLNAATTYLKTQPFVDPLRIGVVGFSMGGTFALTQAGHNSDLKATAAFYGKVPPLETFDYLLCPILYHYGAKDGWVTKQEVELLQQGLTKYGKPGLVHSYPDAGHAFFNDTRPEAYRAQAARLAWERTLQFFHQHLR